jgi:hypothetical protein
VTEWLEGERQERVITGVALAAVNKFLLYGFISGGGREGGAAAGAAGDGPRFGGAGAGDGEAGWGRAADRRDIAQVCFISRVGSRSPLLQWTGPPSGT